MYNFPEIKTTRNEEQNVQKIRDEIKEFEEAEGEHKDMEAVDVLHTVETFIRKRFKGREDELAILIQKVLQKNDARGYYTKDCF